MLHHILIIRAGALGDTILTLPALHALRDRFPHAFIEVAGYRDFWEIARPPVDQVASIDDPGFASLHADTPAPELAHWLRGVDLVVAWTAHNPTSTLIAAGVPEVIHASPHPPPGVHAAEWLLQTIDASPQWMSRDTSLLALSSEEIDGARRTLSERGPEHPIYLHPGSGAAWKCWPADRFAHLGEALRARGHIVLIEGPADAESVAEVQRHATTPFPVLRDLPVRRLAALLSQGALFIGNDSGVTHLAAAVGVPTIALFGPTDPVCWAPLGDIRVIRACSARATHQGQIRVCNDPACMESISVEAVLAEAPSLYHQPYDGGTEELHGSPG